jgi:hypothetical protein
MAVRRVRIPNPNVRRSEKTFLDSDYTAGVALTVVRAIGFQDNDYVVVGEPGEDKTEQKDVTGITGNSQIDISSALRFAHNKGTVVYRSEWNAVQIERRADADSSFSLISTTTLQWDKPDTLYIDTASTSGSDYRFRFINQAASLESEYSPTLDEGGFTNNQIGYMIQEVRDVINDPDRKIVKDHEIIRFLNKAKNIIRAKRHDWYFWEKEDQGSITTTASTRKYNLDTISETMDYVKDVRFRDATGNSTLLYHLRFISELEFDQKEIDQDETDNDSLVYYTIAPPDSSSSSGYIRVDPAPASASQQFYIRYYEPDADYNDVADTTSIPIPSILEDYAVFRCEQIKGDERKAKIYRDLFYGPSDRRGTSDDLTGIRLLEKMHNGRLIPQGKPRVLKKYIGRRIGSRLYGNRFVDRDWIAENTFHGIR